MIKIAFTGVAGAGKGLCVSLVNEMFNNELKIGSFAYPIKKFLGLLCDMTDDHLYGSLKEVPLTFTITPYQYNNAAEYYISSGLDDLVSFDTMWYNFCEVLCGTKEVFDMSGPTWYLHSVSSRQLQQWFGTEIMRSARESVWVDFALSKHYNLIDDMRFPNELDALKDNGYFLIRIVGKESRVSGSASAHASEVSINQLNVDAELDNNFEVYDEDSLNVLKTRLRDLLNKNNLI